MKLLKGIHAKINLNSLQSVAGHALRMLGLGSNQKFSEYVFNAGYSSPVRTPRGRDILAACGQLKSKPRSYRLVSVRRFVPWQ